MEIYIPSKNRPYGKTFKLLEGVKYTVVVEPQDFDKYKSAGHQNILVLPKNDMGIGYARNFIKKQYRGELLVMIDDDIIKFDMLDQTTGRLTNNSNRKTPLEFLALLEYTAQDLEFDLGTIGRRQFVWSTKEPFSYNVFCAAVILINSKTDIWFDDFLRFKEDMDFTLKYIYADKTIVRFNCFAYDTTMASGEAGGLCEQYKNKEDQKYLDYMIQKWPNNCQIVEKYGRIDLKVKYKKL